MKLKVSKNGVFSNPSPTILTTLSDWARQQPQQRIFSFLCEQGQTEQSIEYRHLDSNAQALARHLLNHTKPGERVVMCYHPGLNFIQAFFACLYAGLVAVPIYPPRPRQRLARLQAVVEDCDAALVLSESALDLRAFEGAEQIKQLHDGRLIISDTLALDDDDTTVLPQVTPEHLAFLQYTSGSTGEPKGVMVSHGNIIANLRSLQQATDCCQADIFVNWLPLFHDLGLVNTVLLPVFLGAQSILMAPAAFIMQPRLWLAAIDKYRGTIAGAPNFAFDLCVERIKADDIQALDLSCWRRAFNAAEPINPDTLEAFSQHFAAAGFNHKAHLPSYGMAEATVFLTGGQPDEAPQLQAYEQLVVDDSHSPDKGQKRLVGCGCATQDHEIKIVNPDNGVELAAGHIGEIWASGPSIAQGYWGLPDKTRETFKARLGGQSDDTRDWLRTGDLGCMVDGELYITGRIKELIVIHGQNYYPTDIEQCVQQSHPALRAHGGAAFSLMHNGQERLVVVQEVERTSLRKLDKTAVFDAVTTAVSQHFQLDLMALVLLRPASLKKTSSGKIQRNLAKQQFVNGELSVVERFDPATLRQAYVAPETPLQRGLVAVVAQTLKIELVGIHDSFFQLGANSISLTQIVVRINQWLDIELPLTRVFEHPTISDLAQHIEQTQSDPSLPVDGPKLSEIVTVDRNGALPISLSQQRLWFLWQFDTHATAYNEYRVVELGESVDSTVLERSFAALVDRHEILRTRFVEHHGEVNQVIDKAECFAVRVQNVSAAEPLESFIRSETHHQFKLSDEALFRVKLLSQGARRVLTITLHHIISDGWSIAVMLKELDALYSAFVKGDANPLPPLACQFADYAAWQRQWLTADVREQLLGYWREQLRDLPQLHNLPLDNARPAQQSFNGACIERGVTSNLSVAIDSFCQRRGVTAFMFLQTVFSTLLARLGGYTDVVMGSPVAGRVHQDVEPLIGFFVNTLVLRSDLSDNPSFTQLLERNREMITQALLHQHLPFEVLVEQLNPSRSLSHSPLFQVMLTLHNQQQVEFSVGGNRLISIAQTVDTAKMDIELNIHQSKRGLSFSWVYNRDLFNAGSIEQMAGLFELLLEKVMDAPDTPLLSLDLLCEAQKQTLLVDWNQTQVDWPQGTGHIHRLFEQQAKRHPDHHALIVADKFISYAELNERSNQLAHYLRDLGVMLEQPVGLYLSRSEHMLIGLLAVLKAGAAYVPLDPMFPQARLSHMLSDSGATLVLSEQALKHSLPEGEYQTLCVDDDNFQALMVSSRADNLANLTLSGPHDLAYILYTSGSTGKPKGVMVEHHALSNFLLSMQQQLAFADDEKLLAVTTLSFDISVLELMLPLISGATVVLAQQQQQGDPRQLQGLLSQHGITTMQATPATWRMLVEDGWHQGTELKILCGGEALPQTLARQLLAQSKRVWNVYGPTETTIWSTIEPLQADTPAGVIGRPLANTQIFVLDEQQRPVALGTAGELYIGGDGLARGYWQQRQLSGEKFVTVADIAKGRLYRTGDLVRYLPDGRLQYLARIDSQVKLRGFRLELAEVENQLLQNPVIRDAAVVCRNDKAGEKRLVAYCVATEVPSEQGKLTTAVLDELKQQLPHYMIPDLMVWLDSLPLTANGKVDRKTLPEPSWEALRLSVYVAPRNDSERQLCQIWQDVLALDNIGIEDDFFALGGHSLLATRLVSLIREQMAIEVPLRAVFDEPTIGGFVHLLGQYAELDLRGAITVADRNQPLPLSYAQQRLWFIDQLEQGQGAAQYNMPGALCLQGELNVGALQRAVHTIIERHEVLRTRFITRDGQVYPQIAEQFEISLQPLDLTALAGHSQQFKVAQLSRLDAETPFDLSQDLLLRVQLLKLSEREHKVLFNMHHIASDAWSLGIMVRELSALYDAYSQGLPNPLAALDIQYVDFALWQRNWLKGPVIEQQLKYWREKLALLPQVHNLPLDNPRPPVQSLASDSFKQQLAAPLSHDIERLCLANDATLFMFMQSAFAVLLGRYSGEQDIVVGTPIAGRDHLHVEAMIGFFVNTLVLRSDLSDNPGFVQHLHNTKQTVLDAFAHRDVPFEMLVEALNPERSLAHSPLVQVMLSVQNDELDQLQLPGLQLSSIEHDSSTVKFDLEVVVSQQQQGLQLQWKFNRDLFERETIARMAQNLQCLLEAIVAAPEQPVMQLEMLSASQRHQLLVQWNDTALNYEDTLCFHQLFEAHCLRDGDAVALKLGDDTLSYGALNAQANQLAHYLQAQGVGPNQRVAICVERSFAMIVSMLAVAKAGGAFVPLDARYPEQRLHYVIEDCQPALILTQTHLHQQLAGASCKILLLDDTALSASLNCCSTDNIEPQSLGLTPDDLAYVIYTSGSTGNPKGAMLHHRGLVSTLTACAQLWSLDSDSKMLQFASFGFDSAILEINLPLSCGGQATLISDEHSRTPQKVTEVVKNDATSHAIMIPSMLNHLSTAQWSSVTTLVVAGEAISQDLIARWSSGRSIINAYGPTESTVCVTSGEYRQGPVTIGKPIGNCRVIVVDSFDQPVPVGVAGELLIQDVGLAKGYLNRADLTQQRFIANPFAEVPGDKLYRSGDLVRWRGNGELEFIGRIDHQVKLRGYRIELGEIEVRLARLDNVKEAAVLLRDDVTEDKTLVAYVVMAQGVETFDEAKRQPLIGEFVNSLQAVLPQYMVPKRYVFIDRLPISPNGKIDRKALPKPGESDVLKQAYVAPRNEKEQVLCQIWQEVLGLAEVGIDDNFFALGGDSIVSIQVASRAKLKGLHFNVRQLFEHQTIAALVPHIGENRPIDAPQQAIVGGQALLPVHHYLFAAELSNVNHFNQAVMLQTPAGFDMGALETIVTELHRRHDVLRLRFADSLGNGGHYRDWSQQMLSQTLEYMDLSAVAEDERAQQLSCAAEAYQASLNITEGPIAKAVFFDYGEQRGRLLLIVHHLMIDGVSWRILLSDLNRAWQRYQAGEPLAPAAKGSSLQQWAVQLADWAQSDELGAELSFWQAQQAIEVAALPTEPQPQVAATQPCHCRLDRAETRLLLEQSNGAYRTRLPELLLSALLVAYRRWSGNENLRVLLEGHGREALFDQLDMSETLGWFTSLYPLVLQGGQGDFAEVIPAVKTAYRAVPNNGIGYGAARYLRQDPQLSQTELRQNAILFNYLGKFDSTLGDDGAFVTAAEPVGAMVAKNNRELAQLSFNGSVQDGVLQFSLSADAECFDQAKVQLLMDAFEQALLDCIEHCQTSRGHYTVQDFPNARIEQAALDKLLAQHQQVDDLYVTTPLQAGLLFHGLLDGSGASYTEQTYCDLRGELDVEVFEAAWHQVIDRHGILRTCFVGLSEAQPHQLVKTGVYPSFERLDWRSLSAEQQRADLDKLRQQERARGFDFETAPLMRFTLIHLADDCWHFVWSHHHVLLDGWCLPIVFNEVVESYRAVKVGSAPLLPSVVPYANYIAWLCSQDKTQAREFWSGQLKDFRSVTTPVVDKLPTDEQQNGPRRQTLVLSESVSERLVALAKSSRCTLNVLCQAAYALLLRGYSGEDDILFGTPMSGRPAQLGGVEQMMGLFINTVPVRVRFDDDLTVGALLSNLHRGMVSREQYSYLGLAEIQALSEIPPGVPLFDCLLTFENYPTLLGGGQHRQGPGFEVIDGQSDGLANYGLTAIFHFEQQLHINLDYLAERFAAKTIERLLSHLEQLLSNMCYADPADKVTSLGLLGPGETDTLLKTFNRSDTVYPTGQCVHELFEAQAAARPGNIAVIHGAEKISYGELNEQANQVAHFLIAQGVKPDTLVGLCVERSIQMYIGLLAIMKAGGAYVPLDPSYPQERLEYMVADSAVEIILTESHLYAELEIEEQTIVLLDDEMREAFMGGYSTVNPRREDTGLMPHHLVYAIYTSGSTGMPKGVLVEHHTVVNFLYYSAETFMPEGVEGALVSAPLAFDGTVCTLYSSFLQGKYVELLPAADTAIDLLADYLFDSDRALLFKLTPAHLEALQAHCGGRKNPQARHVFVIAGELLTEKNLSLWRDQLLPGCIFFNEYGPTECTVGTTVLRTYSSVPIKTVSGSVPIGSPLANAKLYVLGPQRQLQPIGTPGELYIGGMQIARGYHGRTDLTAEKFLADPFSEVTAARMYRTGDLVRWLPDGNIEFLGRIDNQVKLRGFRLELGEIEHRLSRLDGIREAVVVLRDDPGQDKRLVAYIVPSEPLEAEDEDLLAEQKLIRVTRFIEALKDSLPQFMIPGIFVFMEQFPLTPNGKVARNHMPLPGEGDLQKQAYEPPRNETEAQLCALFEQVLNVDKISIHDDFFVLGGHSLLATRLISLVREQMQLEVSVKALFDKPTIAGFAEIFASHSRLEKLSRNRQRAQDNADAMIEGEI